MTPQPAQGATQSPCAHCDKPNECRLRRDLLAAHREILALRRQLRHDPLTGLLNRVGLAASWPTPGDLIVVDLDRFKPVNDQYGHDAGDHVLRVAADRLGAYSAVAARLGGDEFAATIPGAAVADAIETAIAEPINLPCGATVHLRASIGVTHTGDGNLYAALRRADIAMYRAKATGVGVAVYELLVDGEPDRAGGRPGLRTREMSSAVRGLEVAR